MENLSQFDQVLLEPYIHIGKSGGKQICTKLIQAFNEWLRIPDDSLNSITEVTDILHNSSLLTDDIEDNSELRRGLIVAHKLFGMGLTINCANLCYFLALQKLIDTIPKEFKLEAVSIYTKQLIILHLGQGLDIYWRDNNICPTEEQYMDMVRKKTGGLFGLCVQLMQLISKTELDLTQLTDCLAEYYQIRDDYANLMSDEYRENKSFAEDLTEGKYSFPMIYTIMSRPDDQTVQEILQKRTKDIKLKEYAIKKMAEFGAFDYTLNRIKELDTKLVAIIEGLGGNPLLMNLVDRLRKV